MDLLWAHDIKINSYRCHTTSHAPPPLPKGMGMIVISHEIRIPSWTNQVANVSGEGLVAVAKMVEGACLQLVCLPFPFLFKITRFSIAEKCKSTTRQKCFNRKINQKWPYLKARASPPFGPSFRSIILGGKICSDHETSISHCLEESQVRIPKRPALEVGIWHMALEEEGELEKKFQLKSRRS